MCDLSSLRLGISESEEEGSEVVMIRSKNRYTHCYIVGATGSGKSTMIANMSVSDISDGNAVIVIDPAGTLSDTILCSVDDEDLDRIVYCGVDFPQCFNLFDLRKKGKNDKSGKDEGILIEDFFSLVDKVVVGGTSTQALTARMKDAFRTALEVVLKEPQPTFYTLVDFLTLKEFRCRLLSKHEVSDYTKDAWKEGGTFAGKQPDVSVIGCIDRLRMFTGSPVISKLCCGRSAVDFNDILDNKKVFILNLDKSGNFIKFLGCLFLHGLQSTILYTSRKVRPVAVYCDEFQLFITPDFQRFFNEGRKFKVSMCLAHQVHSKEAEEVVNTALSNAGTKIAFRSGSREAERISREMVTVAARDIISLQSYYVHCVIDSKPYYFKAKRDPFKQREVEDVDKRLVENARVVEEKLVPVREEESAIERAAVEEGMVEIAVERTMVEEPVKEREKDRFVGYEWFSL